MNCLWVCLFLGAIFNVCGGKAVYNSGDYSRFLSRPPIGRFERDTEAQLMENAMGDGEPSQPTGCDIVSHCHFRERYADYYTTMRNFRFEQVYEKLENSWCGPRRESCWDDNKCDDNRLKFTLEQTVKIIQWMCEHKDGFEDTTCYGPPFAQMMRSCMRREDFSEDGAAFRAALLNVKNCALTGLDALPGCSRDNFFATFFTHALELRMARP